MVRIPLETIDHAANLFVQRWGPGVAYLANQPTLDPTGVTIVRIASGTSRALFDDTERAAWTVVTVAGSPGPAGSTNPVLIDGGVP